MTPQTKDNFRCLAAVIFAIAATILEFKAQEAWFPHLPAWTPIVFFFAMLPVVVRLFNPRYKPDCVSFDDITITRRLPSGKTEAVRWDDLQEVGVITTDEGPFNEDVYWILSGSTGGCAVSGGAIGMKELLERLQKLPDFNNQAVIEAMGSTKNDRFLCWKRNVETPTKDKA